MFNLISEYFPATSAVPLALSAATPAARRAVERSSRGYVVRGLRLHHEDFRKDEEVSCHRRPTRTVCIHAEVVPTTFFLALWWVEKDGADVPVAFRAARLTGVLHYGAAQDDGASPNVLSMANVLVASLVRRTVSLFLGGSRLREVLLNPAAVRQLERMDVSNCRCLKSLQWSGNEEGGVQQQQQQLRHLRILKASFSGLISFPAPTVAAWAPNLTTALLSGCRTLSVAQANTLLDGCVELRVARLDSTKLSSIDSIAHSCPNLTELNVSNCSDLHDVGAIAALALLRVLDLHGNAALTSLNGVEACHRLRRLDISHCKRVTTLQPLEGNLMHLVHFNASHCSGLRDTHLQALQDCDMLEEVKVNQCASLKDFTALADHANLHSLEAADTGLDAVDFLSSCTALAQLSVAGCAALKDLAALRGLYRLTSVDACYTGVTRVADLVDSCAALRVVLVRECVLDAESTTRLEECATRIASTHRTVRSSTSISASSATA